MLSNKYYPDFLASGAFFPEECQVAALAVILPGLAAIHTLQLDAALRAREAVLVKLFPVNNQLDV